MGQIFSDDILELIGPHLVTEHGNAHQRQRPIPIDPSPTLETLRRLRASPLPDAEMARLERTVEDAKEAVFNDESAESALAGRCAETTALMVRGIGIGGGKDLVWKLSILLAEVMGDGRTVE